MMPRSAVVFGSAISSARANGATIFFRGLCRALAKAGLTTYFAERSPVPVPDGELPAEVSIWRYATAEEVGAFLVGLPAPRLVLKFAICGQEDAKLEEAIFSARERTDLVLLIDGDAPVVLDYIRNSPDHHLRSTAPRFDGVLVLAGGPAAAAEYRSLGARRTHWGYCAVDEEFWRPMTPARELDCDLLFVGNRLADRDERVREYLFRTADLLPDHRFLLAGADWEETRLPRNVRWVDHLPAGELRRAYSSARAVLNVNRAPMASYGYSPASRLFEAASCGACVLSDRWPGIEDIFTPGREILLAGNADEVADTLKKLDWTARRLIGLAARQRVLRDHTCRRWVEWLYGVAAERERIEPPDVAIRADSESTDA